MPSNKQVLDQVSLVCVETRRPKLAQYALERCLSALSFKECILLCNKVHPLPAYIGQVVIPPLDGIKGYSSFMLKDVGNYFSGEFALVVQWDGFVLNGACWDDEYLQYDYIGAPWPHRPVDVGNGGFSLRSRKLIEALKKIDIDQVHPEDYVICELHRDVLIREHGIKFAPFDVASKFSFEFIAPAGSTFGFHGFSNFHTAFDDAGLLSYIDQCDRSILHSRAARNLMRNLCRQGRLSIADELFRRSLRFTARGIYDALGLYIWMSWRKLSRHFVSSPVKQTVDF